MAVQDRDFRYKMKTSMYRQLKPKFKLNILLYVLVVIVCLWISITSTIQRFKNPKLTETELFLSIPENIILNFN